MRLITLNIWGGQVFEPLINFIKNNSGVDIFCFQEVLSTKSDKITDEGKKGRKARVNILQEIKTVLPSHVCHFTVLEEGFNYFPQKFVDYDLSAGTAIFEKKNINITEYSSPFIYGKKNSIKLDNMTTFAKTLEQVSFRLSGQQYNVFNIHGPWFPGGKTDNPKRLEFFKKVHLGLQKAKGKKILCGDFNLLPDTASLGIVENGMKNLVKEFGIKSTRNKLYKYFDQEPLHADYILVSPEVDVKDFKVLPDEVSDHAALMLEFE